MSRILVLIAVITLFASLAFGQDTRGTEGVLFARDKQGPLGFCPLKTTRVRADISGFIARVTVVQEFENTYGDPIEATYTFPLSQNSAVDNMTMRIGERVIRARVMKREEARKTYEAAKAAGRAASLLDQQRPNIFTQSVANIMPGEKVLVEISYVETLRYEDGQYEFVFPMTVGPRYNPTSMTPQDARNISSPVTKDRSGHDISIEVNLDAGLPIEDARSASHEIDSTQLSPERRKVTLRSERTIPNKDFILRYDVTGKKIQDAIITYRGEKGGFFAMMLQPPDSFAPKDVMPKEIVFVLDTSGSMNGRPIEKAKESMNLALNGLNPQDTFNLITFAGDTSILFDRPMPATRENLEQAQSFLASRQGYGGTEMMKAVKAALEPSESQKHVRIACFMTDGYVGNEAQIIAEIRKYSNARVFAFGIGNAVNRYLLDKMALEGRGEVEYVGLNDDGSKAAYKFHERVRNPLLTDISIDWNQMGATDVYPGRHVDLFSAKPVALTGRFKKSGNGAITLKGKMAGLDYQRDINVNLPESETGNDALASIWARARVDELTSKYYAAKAAEKKPIENEITQLGLEFRLMTQFTSFVAVEEKVVNQNGKSIKVEVPIQLAEGTFGNQEGDLVASKRISSLSYSTPQTASGNGSGSGNPHGYVIQGQIGRRNQNATEVENRPANVTGLEITVAKAESDLPAQGRATQSTVVPDGSTLDRILSRVEVHRQSLRSLKADVKLSAFDAKSSETQVREGKTIYLPGVPGTQSSTRIDWSEPEEKLSLINGIYTVYRPKLQQATIGGSSFDETTRAGLLLLNMLKMDLKAVFDIALSGTEEVSPGVAAWHLEIRRKGVSADQKPIHIWVDRNGMIVQGKFTFQDGNVVTLLFTGAEKNVQIKPEDLKIAYPGDTKIVRAGEPETK